MKKVALLLALLALTACQSMSDVKPGDGRKATITGKTYEQIWDAAYKVADEHFEIREQDKARGVIVGERTMHVWSSGVWVGTYITPPTPGAASYTVEVVRRKKVVVTQVGEQDWEYKVLRDIYRQLGLRRSIRSATHEVRGHARPRSRNRAPRHRLHDRRPPQARRLARHNGSGFTKTTEGLQLEVRGKTL